MSLSNPREQSPVTKFFKIRASTGHVTHWDKAASKEIESELPFRFTVLDSLTTIKGYSEAANSGVWSNEVRDLRSGILNVRTKNGPLAEGTYASIKDKLKALGGKYAHSVYMAYKEGNDLVIGNIVFVGAAVTSWIDFTKGRRLDLDPGVAITGFTEEKKGRTEYFAPVFERLAVSGDTLQAAQLLDQDLQAYLATALNRNVGNSEDEAQQSFTAPPQQGSFTDSGADDFAAAPPF